jgi:hypothetical protein
LTPPRHGSSSGAVAIIRSCWHDRYEEGGEEGTMVIVPAAIDRAAGYRLVLEQQVLQFLNVVWSPRRLR